MSETVSEKRMAKNEVLFRQRNEQIPKNLERLKKEAKEEGDDSLMPDTDMPLHFYCECSDENCRERIVLRPSEYEGLHQNISQFIVLPGHNAPNVERIVKTTDKYMVVEKYETPPTADTLKPTPIGNI